MAEEEHGTKKMRESLGNVMTKVRERTACSMGGGEKREDMRAGEETPALARSCIFIYLSI